MGNRWFSTALVISFFTASAMSVTADEKKPAMPRIDMVLVKGGGFMM